MGEKIYIPVLLDSSGTCQETHSRNTEKASDYWDEEVLERPTSSTRAVLYYLTLMLVARDLYFEPFLLNSQAFRVKRVYSIKEKMISLIYRWASRAHNMGVALGQSVP